MVAIQKKKLDHGSTGRQSISMLSRISGAESQDPKSLIDVDSGPRIHRTELTQELKSSSHHISLFPV